MYRLLTKYGTGFAFGLGLLVTLIFLIPAVSGIGDFNMLPPDQKGTTTIFNAGLFCAIALIVICFVISVLFGVYQLATNPKGAVKFIISIAVIAVLFFILYSIATPETTAKMQALSQEFNITDGVSKFISAALWTVIALAAVATGTFVLAEIRNLFK
jgi:ABC-type multidrug transport system fused ATPase/permease subunit